jgi:hypothetical protein
MVQCHLIWTPTSDWIIQNEHLRLGQSDNGKRTTIVLVQPTQLFNLETRYGHPEGPGDELYTTARACKLEAILIQWRGQVAY